MNMNATGHSIYSRMSDTRTGKVWGRTYERKRQQQFIALLGEIQKIKCPAVKARSAIPNQPFQYTAGHFITCKCLEYLDKGIPQSITTILLAAR